VGHASISNGLLHVKVSLARGFQSDLKTDGGATTGGARGGLCRTLLPYFCRFQCMRH
jgi:hypothetical protein